jgi:hypothetical protein
MTSSSSAPCERASERRLRLPDVLADQQADLEAAEARRPSAARRREVALLVEHAVVRQAGLAMIREDRAVAISASRIVDLRAAVLGIANDHADALRRLAHALERRA